MSAETPPKRPLFRPEAVEHHAKARTGGRTLELRDNRVAWLFRGLLAAVAVAVALAFTIRTGTSATGPVVVHNNGRHVSFFVADPRRIPDDAVATVRAGGVERTARVHQRSAREVLLVADGDLPDGATGSAVVPLGERSVAGLLLGWDR